MAFILGEKERIVMVDYNDLRKAYITYDEAKNQYWSSLESGIKQLTEGFANYLNIGDQYYYDRNDNKISYLRLGTYDNNKFEEKQNNFQKNGKNLSIPFALSITLDKSVEFFPKFNLILLLEISKKKDVFKIDIFKEGNVKKFETSDPYNAKYVFEQLVNDIYESLNPEVF